MSELFDTTPKVITDGIRTFCETIASSRPMFVRCKPDNDAKPSACFDNVVRKIPRAGGSPAYGWAIWALPRMYHEAEHHCVWRNRNGDLIDITPQPNRPKRIVFLPDQGAVYDPSLHRSNVIRAASIDPNATEFAQLMKRRYAIHDGYRIDGNTLALFTLSDQKELGDIERRLESIWQRMAIVKS